MLRASVGRAGETEDLQRDDDDLVRLVRHELRPLIGIDARRPSTRSSPAGAAVCRSTPSGTSSGSRGIRAAVAAVPGLAVCGATYDGVGIPACIASATRRPVRCWRHSSDRDNDVMVDR